MKGKQTAVGNGIKQTRRHVLLSGGKVLPALAVMGLALAAAVPAHAEDADCGACSSSCSGSCYKGCTGSCEKGCTGSCMEGCTGGPR